MQSDNLNGNNFISITGELAEFALWASKILPLVGELGIMDGQLLAIAKGDLKPKDGIDLSELMAKLLGLRNEAYQIILFAISDSRCPTQVRDSFTRNIPTPDRLLEQIKVVQIKR